LTIEEITVGSIDPVSHHPPCRRRIHQADLLAKPCEEFDRLGVLTAAY
jgi:hypothetical protein